MVGLSTLCYIEKDGKYLMLHRTVKKNDVNKDKWIGVGGHFEADESPEECLVREVKEETGLTLTSYQYRGIVTFVSGDGVTEYMSLYTADGFTGEQIPCDEGQLEWVEKKEVLNLNIWEGDKIFFRLIQEDIPFFSLKLVYDGANKLIRAVLNGKPLELLDVLDSKGRPTGVVRERGVAHRDGSPHPTSHIWIVRSNDKSGCDVMLQKRSNGKDYAGCYDISSAGHVSAGDHYLESAIREIGEELGLEVLPEELKEVGLHSVIKKDGLPGQPYNNHEISQVYVYDRPVDIQNLHLQESEVEAVIWMDYGECRQRIMDQTLNSCIWIDEFEMLGRFLGIR
ncbi:MAG TPA: NUDIX domain-containing protein [Candidatus Pelethocola excrementipullorum]|nr:NUDIX domain-containing protein [Candidatus Pelethocola excrementipullorum]